ncbi:MAG: hypothetical protein F4X08_01260 [Gemmatimonadetes bacterium]|nr:hypothetical protein [Gemmatimonadota bacterium]
MTKYKPGIKKVPKLLVSRRVVKTPQRYNSDKAHFIRYRSKKHATLPHVVKFSAGRSSAMMLFALLENNLLDADRGDVIVFNNTSAEHPGTYRFARTCNRISNQYGIPFYWIEFQTYEDARNGEWTRLPSYRLVNDQPYSTTNPDGFHWRGEVFEELLSWAGYVPNQFSRICTKNMKLEVTRTFLKDWFAFNESIPRLGHYGSQSRIDPDSLYRRHIRNQGAVPKHIFLRKRSYVLTRPHVRPEQSYSDFSPVWRRIENDDLIGNTFGDKVKFGNGGVEYVAYVGLRGDEPMRVKRVEARSAGPGASGYEGEHVYMPLADMNVTREDVNDFWEWQDWDLSLPKEGSLSNCVYCFLKGVGNLKSVHEQMTETLNDNFDGFGSLRDTPCDITWWSRIENDYSRDLIAENREIKGNHEHTSIGFFGMNGFSYDTLSVCTSAELEQYSDTLLPCDCTE